MVPATHIPSHSFIYFFSLSFYRTIYIPWVYNLPLVSWWCLPKCKMGFQWKEKPTKHTHSPNPPGQLHNSAKTPSMMHLSPTPLSDPLIVFFHLGAPDCSTPLMVAIVTDCVWYKNTEKLKSFCYSEAAVKRSCAIGFKTNMEGWASLLGSH